MDLPEEYKYLEKYLQHLKKREGFSSECQIEVKPGTIKGEGFLGKIFFVSVTENEKKLNVVVKSAIQNEKMRKELKISNIYSNETNFYNTIYPALKSFEKSANVKKPLSCAPNYYGCSMEEGTESLGLENLKLLNYEIFSKKLLFDANHIKLLFKTYGQYHGTSFAYSDQRPEEFKKLMAIVYNIYDVMATNDGFPKTVDQIKRDTYDRLKEEINPELLKKLAQLYSRSCEIVLNSSGTNKKYKTLLHGDCWSNNMMFKYQVENAQKVPIDMKLLDFQLIGWSSPVNDLSYSFYASASTDEYAKLDDYLKVYHDSLSERIRELGSDPDKLYPFSQLKADWIENAEFGLLMAIVLHRMKLTDNDAVQDLDDYYNGGKDNEIFVENYDKQEFLRRVKHLLIHCNEFGVI